MDNQKELERLQIIVEKRKQEEMEKRKKALYEQSKKEMYEEYEKEQEQKKKKEEKNNIIFNILKYVFSLRGIITILIIGFLYLCFTGFFAL